MTQIVTDSGTDVCLTPDQMVKFNVHEVPLSVTLEGTTYREGVDIEPEEFYRLLAASDELPTTSQPPAGDFAALYDRLAADDPDILSIHMSSGLSGTVNSARTAAGMVPEANVTVVDTKTLSAAAGWQVEAAARGASAGWPVDRILGLIERIGDASESIYTLKELKYLIHGGRISHMKGLIASVLHIKPLIGVEKENGTYVRMGQVRTFRRAIKGLGDLITRQHAPGSALRVQVLHSYNPDGAAELRECVDQLFNCTWLPTRLISLVLGAHTGPSMVGVAYAPAPTFAEVP